MPNSEDYREQWALVRTPLGEPWSGRTRYAAAMYFHKRAELSDAALEVYRVCSRLDLEDPLSMIRERGVGEEWLSKVIGNATPPPGTPERG